MVTDLWLRCRQTGDLQSTRPEAEARRIDLHLNSTDDLWNDAELDSAFAFLQKQAPIIRADAPLGKVLQISR